MLSILSGLQQDVKVGKDDRLEKMKSFNNYRKKNFQSLIKFLSSTDQSDSEYGSEMMNLQLINEDLGMTDLMKENLHLTDEEVISAIISFLKDLDLKKSDESAGLSEEEFLKIVEELPLKWNVNEAILHLFPFYRSLIWMKITFKTDQNFADLAKSIKAY